MKNLLFLLIGMGEERAQELLSALVEHFAGLPTKNDNNIIILDNKNNYEEDIPLPGSNIPMTREDFGILLEKVSSKDKDCGVYRVHLINQVLIEKEIQREEISKWDLSQISMDDIHKTIKNDIEKKMKLSEMVAS